ncbi:MAG TPA: hypothetical protein VGC65_00985 [Bacteroidia bacterium]|jgi:hypothetical protein
MTRKIIIFTLLLNSIIPYSNAQKLTIDSIVGRWVLYQQSLDSSLIYDVTNPRVMMKYSFWNLKKLKPNYTISDSLKLVENVEAKLVDFKKMFIQFNVDSTYTNRKIKGGGKVTDDVEEGRFVVNVEDQTLTQTDLTGRTLTTKVILSDGILRLIFDYPRPFELAYKKALTTTH